MQNKFYVTTPIYYVNDQPHVGHAYTTVLADVLARYHRLLGVPTFFLTGTDEHGQKVAKAAAAAGLTPQEQADRTVVRFQELWTKLGITHDDFIRTTEGRHKVVVQKILQDLFQRGEIYRAEYDGWYCVPCERFFTEKDLVAGNCPDCGRPVEKIKEANYFFRMGKYQQWLLDYIQAHPKFIQPDFRRNETLGFLRQPLNDLCISRPKSRLAWGIELPFDADYVCYVWFDALVNYISAVGYLSDDAKFRQWWPCSVHLIGKDILTTHTVYWPTMLQAMGLPQPEMIFAHGWWLTSGSKMSKTAGNVVNPMELAERYGVDAFRYFLIAEMAMGQDASFTEDSFVRRFNADLANDLGNLLNRITNMVGRYFAGRLPAPAADALAGAEEKTVWDTVQAAVTTLEQSVTGMRLHEGIGAAVGAVKAINRYLELKQPWTLAKQPDKAPLGTTLFTAAETLRVAASLLFPVMPEKMAVVLRALGLTELTPKLDELRAWGVLKPGTPVQDCGPLFPRVVAEEKTAAGDLKTEARGQKTEDSGQKSEVSPEKAAAAAPAPATHAAKPSNVVELLDYAYFAKLDLRTAKIINAAKIEGADKLLKLDVFVGEERRQIVAGIALHYTPEQLIGKTVVIVANLKPAKIRGVESQGMLLAASKGEKLLLVTVDGELSSGAKVK
jgi:methionyl-tRNA synthetase